MRSLPAMIPPLAGALSAARARRSRLRDAVLGGALGVAWGGVLAVALSLVAARAEAAPVLSADVPFEGAQVLRFDQFEPGERIRRAAFSDAGVKVSNGLRAGAEGAEALRRGRPRPVALRFDAPVTAAAVSLAGGAAGVTVKAYLDRALVETLTAESWTAASGVVGFEGVAFDRLRLVPAGDAPLVLAEARIGRADVGGAVAAAFLAAGIAFLWARRRRRAAPA